MAGLVGIDGDELRFVEFTPGSARVDTTQRAKLDALASALAERPGLSLELAGASAPSLDRPALQAATLDDQLRQMRFEELKGKWVGDKPERVDDVMHSQEELARLLVNVYRDRFGEDPTGNDAALLSRVRARLEADLKIDDATLRVLARTRAKAIRDALVADGRVVPERVFLLPPTIEDHEAAAGARSMMSLTAH